MASEILIRSATVVDEAAIGAVLTASYTQLMKPDYDAALLARALPLLTRPQAALLSSGTYYVAESKDGRLVGCGGWTKERPGSGEVVPGLAHIRHFATHPDWTGRGIGRLLFDKCAEEARALGVKRFEVCSSLNAEAFYAALGFETLRLSEVQMKPGLMLPTVFMRRSI